MLLNIVVVALVGFAVAGILMLAFRLMGRKPPKLLMLTLVALAIVAFNTYYRYGWASRIEAGLGADVVVVDRVHNTNFILEPWTRFFPMVSGLVTIDKAASRPHPTQPHLVLAKVMVARQDADTLEFRYVVDCRQARWFDMNQVAAERAASDRQRPLPKDGLPPEDAPWDTSGQPAYLFDTVCPPAS